MTGLFARFRALRSGSFAAEFARTAAQTLAEQPVDGAPAVTEAELAALPPLMQRYLRNVGAVGRPHVRNFHVTFDTQIRSGPDAPYMVGTAEQYEFFHPAVRLFHMQTSRVGVPIDVLHRYVGDSATMRVRLAGLIPIVNASGRSMTKSETVTLLNDIVILAPAAVLDLPITWETTGEHTVRATFTNAEHTVSATLTFNDAGDLTGFLSADRAQETNDGSTPAPFSTPLSNYRIVDGIRVAGHGDANWIGPKGEWTYGRFEIMHLAYNVRR